MHACSLLKILREAMKENVLNSDQSLCNFHIFISLVSVVGYCPYSPDAVYSLDVIKYCTGCPKKHVRRSNGYCEGAINQIFLFYQFMNRRDFHLKFGTEFD